MKGTLIAAAITLANALGTAVLAYERQHVGSSGRTDVETQDGSNEQAKQLSAGKAMPLLFQNGKATTILFGYVEKAR
jgi:hypothetical protein